uniref:H/ACA ribonucleoprotein complex subunit n=1 Tax=Schistosoma haematobium TaxID=6185 RepID=A0A095A029_SCHHA
MGFQNFRGRGGGSRGSQGGFRRGSRGGGFSDKFQSGPPEEVVEVGVFAHPCQEDIVCKITSEKIPYSNASVYLANKEEIGKVDEVFGPIKDAYFSIKLSDTLKSKSFQEGVKGKEVVVVVVIKEVVGADMIFHVVEEGGILGVDRGGFRGGREMNGQRGGERHSFGGKRGANFSASNTPQSKKFKSED